MTFNRWWIALAAAVAGVAAAAQPSAAQNYPGRAVKLVVPYAPGGPNDIIGRLLAQKLSESMGGQFFVENQPGGGGTIATGAVANAPADGYTLLVANQDLIVQPIVKAKVPYDPFKSFAPLTLVVTAPEMLVVNPALPAKNMQELIALLKANPGKFNYASPGYGTTPHLACEWLFRLEYNLDVVHVPFQGAAPAVQSVLAGDTPILHNVLPAVAPYVRDGRMRALAIAAKKRSPVFPDVPTLEEAGIPGHEVSFWMGVLAPAGTPKDVVDALQRQIAKAMSSPDAKERLATIGFDPTESTPDQFAAHIKAESDKWAKVVRDANIKID